MQKYILFLLGVATASFSVHKLNGETTISNIDEGESVTAADILGHQDVDAETELCLIRGDDILEAIYFFQSLNSLAVNFSVHNL